jgi:hypothetical protein
VATSSAISVKERQGPRTTPKSTLVQNDPVDNSELLWWECLNEVPSAGPGFLFTFNLSVYSIFTAPQFW